jgi:hypothetical protein
VPALVRGVRPRAASLLSQDEYLVRGLRLLLGDHGAADGHDHRDDAVDALGALVPGGLEVARRVLGVNVAAHLKRSMSTPAGTVEKASAFFNSLFEQQSVQVAGSSRLRSAPPARIAQAVRKGARITSSATEPSR